MRESGKLRAAAGLFRGPSQRLRETIAIYRQVFQRDDQSRLVLVWLIERCGLMRRIESEEQRVLHNWGIEMLENMGITQGANYRKLVDAMLKMAIPDEAIDSKE